MVYRATNTAENLLSREQEIIHNINEMTTLDTRLEAKNDGVDLPKPRNEGFDLGDTSTAAKLARAADSKDENIKTGVSTNSNENSAENQRNKRFQTEQILTEISQSTSQALASIAEIDARLDELRQRQAELEAENEILDTRIDLLQEQIAETEAQLEVVDQNIAATEEELEQSDVQIANLTAQSEIAEQNIATLDDKIAETTDEIDDLQESIDRDQQNLHNNTNLNPIERVQLEESIAEQEEEKADKEEEVEIYVDQRANEAKSQAEIQAQLLLVQQDQANTQTRLEQLQLEQQELNETLNQLQVQTNEANVQRELNELESIAIVNEMDALSIEREEQLDIVAQEIKNPENQEPNAELEEVYDDLILRQARLAEEIEALQNKNDGQGAIAQKLEGALESGAEVSDRSIYEELAEENDKYAELYAARRIDQYELDWSATEEAGLDNTIMGKRGILSADGDAQDPTLFQRTLDPLDNISENRFSEIASNVFDNIGSAIDGATGLSNDFSNVAANEDSITPAIIQPAIQPDVNNDLNNPAGPSGMA